MTDLNISLSGLCLFIVSLTWACFEVQVEGIISWAGSLIFTTKFKLPLFPKDITGYHVLLGAIMALLLGFPFIFLGLDFTSRTLWIIASCLILIILFEDYLYNIVNPWEEYGWHVSFVERHFPAMNDVFIAHIPLEYWLEALISSLFWRWGGGDMRVWLSIFGTILFLTAAITILLPVFFKEEMEKWALAMKKIAILHLIYPGDEEYKVILMKGKEVIREFTTKGIPMEGRFAPGYVPQNYMEDKKIKL